MENIHQLVYLCKVYPKKKIAEIAALFEMSPIDFNIAAWRAIDAGYISSNKKTGKVKLKRTPDVWVFSDSVQKLMDAVHYAIEKLSKDEADVEENYLSNWCQGYPAHELVIVLHQLQELEHIESYVIKDGDEEYTFYTAKGNAKHRWGKKQFKDKKKLK